MLSGQATASPNSGDSVVEMIRHLKVARDTAVKARTQAMQTMKAVIVSAPDTLREDLDQVAGKMALVRRLAGLRAGPITTTTASAKASLRAIARRWLALDAEIKAQEAQLEYIDSFYNPVRRHSALDFVSPAMFERQATPCAGGSPLKRGKARRALLRCRGTEGPADPPSPPLQVEALGGR